MVSTYLPFRSVSFITVPSTVHNLKIKNIIIFQILSFLDRIIDLGSIIAKVAVLSHGNSNGTEIL